jgi:hypothetical protein
MPSARVFRAWDRTPLGHSSPASPLTVVGDVTERVDLSTAAPQLLAKRLNLSSRARKAFPGAFG